MNEQIVKLNRHIASAWQNLENTVKSRNLTASQDAINKLTNFENLKVQQIALDQNIEVSTSVPSKVNGHPNGAAHQSEPVYFQSRRKRSTIRPQEIRIGSFRKPINIANQIPITTANWLIEQGKTLPTIPNFIHPTNSGFSQSAAPRQLINGSFIEIGDNQEILIQKARRLLDACGFRNLKIEIFFEDGTTKNC